MTKRRQSSTVRSKSPIGIRALPPLLAHDVQPLDEIMKAVNPSPPVAHEIVPLRSGLEEVEDTLHATGNGQVDGLVVAWPDGDQLPTKAGAEHPYQLFVEEMTEGAFTLTADGLILFCNRRFAEILNVSVHAIVGRNIDSIPIPEVRACLATFLTAAGTPCEEISYGAGEDARILKLSTSRFSPEGSLAVLVADVTEARRRETNLLRANKEMEDHIRERTAFLSRTVDELREARLAAMNMMEDAVGAARALDGSNRELKLQFAETKRSDEAHRRLATVVEQAAEAIVITEIDGTIVYVNPAFERISGYTREEAIGQNPRFISSGKQTSRFYRDLWTTISTGGVWQGHFINRRKDGSHYEEEATISPVRDASGTIINYVAIKRDVTAEVALGDQLRHAQKIEAVGTLAGGVAHDFNNLLQSMLSIVQLLRKKGAESTRYVEHLAQLEKTIRRGSYLTRQLLLFARHEISVHANVDLNQILRDLLEFLHRVVRANIHLSVEPANAPLWISADHGQIEQVIMNLVVNAIDAMPEGGALCIATGGDDRTAWLKVSDTGTGIPETVRDRIFEPFFTTKEPGKGTGLGLSVAHGIVVAHGGRIDVGCPSGGGTVFRVALPLQNAVPAAEPAAPAAAEQLTGGRGERVLLVEDDPAAREGLSGILEMLNYSVVAVGTGEDAVGIDEKAPFAVVLTDSMLPGMPGIEVVRRLRERWPDMKAILMSGYAAPGVIDAAIAANELRFLQKPFDMTDLARTLRAVLRPPDPPERPQTGL